MTSSNGHSPATEDTTPSTDALLQDLQTLADTLETPPESAAEMRNRVEAAVHLAQQAVKLANEVEAEQAAALEAQQRRIDELEAAVEELRDDQRLLTQLGDAVASDRDARAAVILQSLYRDAKGSGTDTARMTAREAWNTVQRAVARPRMNDHLRYIEDLVGDTDVCYYVERPRGADPPSHLVLDLSAGHLPAKINGRRIKLGGTDDG